MIKLKKLLRAAALAVATAALLAGCGGQGTENATAPNEQALKVGSAISFAPFEFQDETQAEYQGFDMDLIRAIGKEMGRPVEISNIGFDGLIPALQAKTIDVAISGMTINDERKQNVEFSAPYYKSGLTIVVLDSNEDIKTFQDLRGKRIAVQIGTTSANEVKKIDGADIKEFNTPPDCFMELKAGGVDAVVNDKPVNDYYITQSGQTGVKEVGDRLTADDYGIAITKGNTALADEINNALQKLKDNGEYDKIYAKWFGNAAK